MKMATKLYAHPESAYKRLYHRALRWLNQHFIIRHRATRQVWTETERMERT